MLRFKVLVRRFLSRFSSLDILARHCYVIYKSMIYRYKYFRSEVIEDRFIFESFGGASIADSPYYLYLELRKKHPKATFIWVAKDLKSVDFKLLDKNVQLVKYKSKEYFQGYATASYWIVNCRLPFEIVKKKGQVYIQTWHGTPLKKLANDLSTSNNAISSLGAHKFSYKLEANRLDFFLSPSKYATDRFCSSFQLQSDKILELGYPRNDLLYSKRRDEGYINELKQKLSIPLNKKVILYAPTWRDNKYDSESMTHIHTNLLECEEFLSDFKDTIFLYRGHYFTKTENAMNAFIDVSEHNLVNDLLLISDCLITDYSSIFFDYALLYRPIYFYMPDLEEYSNATRGFYLDVEKDLPGTISRSISELKTEIKSGRYNETTLKEFNVTYNPYEDGKSSIRVIDNLGV
ncbi:CDP-glycerol glycerophosphotransferase family protein [Vibrio breoganii]